MTTTKSYEIPKQYVREAYKRVKANRGASGIDRQTIEGFEKELSKNLYKVWNRMSSGSYFPPPVREVEIPKKNGGTRKLGVPTVADRIAQTVVKQVLEPILEPIFHRDSYGFRPGKSARDAVEVTRKRCWRYDWVLEFDIKGAFDNIDHELLTRALKRHTACKWVLKYVDRWLKAPFARADGTKTAREAGTPQGGVISPLLTNLFFHYAFDLWMAKNHPESPFARYADDAVIHCRTREEAEKLLKQVKARFEECKLELHPEKTHIVYCKDSNRRKDYSRIQFTFLGFTFRPRRAKNRQGEVFTSFLPGASQQAQSKMKQEIRRWRIPTQSPGTLEEFSKQYNPVLRGWWNYFGGFYRTGFWNVFLHFNRMLSRWARRKYKTLHRHPRRSRQWLNKIARRSPQLFVHWQHMFAHTT